MNSRPEFPQSGCRSSSFDWRIALCVAVALFAWSSGNVVSRIAVGGFSAGELALFRLLSSCIVIDLIAVFRRTPLPAQKDIPLFLLLGACGYALYTESINLGVRTESASSLSFLLATLPFATAVIARLVLHEPFPLWKAALALFSLGGVAIIAFQGGGRIRSGAVWIVLAVFCLSLYQVILRKLAGKYSSFQISTYSLNLGTLLMLWNLPALLQKLGTIRPIYIICGLWLGLMTTAAAYFCWAYAMQRVQTAAGLNMWVFLTPPLTVFLAGVLLGETIGIRECIGGCMILIGLILSHFLPRLFSSRRDNAL